MKQFIETIKTLEYKKEIYFFAFVSAMSFFIYLLDNSLLHFSLISIWAFSGLIVFIQQETALLFYTFKAELKNPNFNLNDIEKRKMLKRDICRVPLILFIFVFILPQASLGLSALSEIVTSIAYFSIPAVIYYNLNKFSKAVLEVQNNYKFNY